MKHYWNIVLGTLLLVGLAGWSAVAQSAPLSQSTPTPHRPIETTTSVITATVRSTVSPTHTTTSRTTATVKTIPTPAATATAKTTPTPASAATIANRGTLMFALEETLQNIYARVSPSVVHIQVVLKQTEATQPFHNFPNIPGFPSFPDDQQSPQDFFSRGQGSGFVWDTEGHIVTNNHVVEGAERITVIFADGTTTDAKLVGADPDSDLAVVKVTIPADQLQPIEVIDSASVKVGNLAIAIGNPFGLEGTMTVGFISALGRSLPVESALMSVGPTYTIPDIIQTDASINPGNSGGVLVNTKGQLIGVPTAIQSPVRASVGIGLAIPSTIVKQVVPSLVENGHYEHAWLGLSGTTMDPDIAKAMGLEPSQRGALVIDVTSGGPSDKAGIHGSDQQVTIQGRKVQVGGDVIIAFDGKPVKAFDDLVAYLARYTKANQRVVLTILRKGKQQEITVTLGVRPGSKSTARSSDTSKTSDAWLGVQGETITQDIAEAMKLSADQKGVLIRQVEQGSPADKAGLRGSFKSIVINGERTLIGGDIIVAADGKSITQAEDLQAFVQGKNAGDQITLTILQGGTQKEVKVRLEKRP